MDNELKQLSNDLIKEMIPKIKEEFTNKFKGVALGSIKPYFMDHHDRQKFKDNPTLSGVYGINKNNVNDIGMVNDMINDQVSELILSEETKNYIKNQIDREFKRHLDDAIELAMKHHAKRVAFTVVENTVNK